MAPYARHGRLDWRPGAGALVCQSSNLDERLSEVSWHSSSALIHWMTSLFLVGTGLFQMSQSQLPVSDIDNRWSAAILLKHLVFLGMTGVSLTWG
jgi:hypothetical protein